LTEEERVNGHFERIFAVGVDEMSWDDYGRDPTEWPSVADVRRYRQQVKAKVGVSSFHNNSNWQ
jgi:hypothetical protein